MSYATRTKSTSPPSIKLQVLMFVLGAAVGSTAGIFAADMLLGGTDATVFVAVFWGMLGGLIGYSMVEQDLDPEASRELEEEWATHWRGMP